MEKKPFAKLSELQGGARLVKSVRFVGIHKNVTTVWKLDDGSSIVIKGIDKKYYGKPATMVQEIEKSNVSFEEIVRKVSSDVEKEIASQGVQLCL